MYAFLLEWLPRLIPGWIEGRHFLLIKHQGKSDLEKSIPVKLKAWREPGVRFVIVRDNDGADCRALKSKLLKLCGTGKRPVMVRLVCQELEAWYLGDADALSQAYPEEVSSVIKLTKRFADPDACLKPSVELEREIPSFQKQDAARRLGRLVDASRTRSRSCIVFASGVVRVAQGQADAGML